MVPLLIQLNQLDQLNELITYVKRHSPFYRALYEKVPVKLNNVTELPLLDAQKYWSEIRKTNNSVLTAAANGFALRSGGTSGHPKLSLYAFKEWEQMAQAVGEALGKTDLKDSDRVANCLFAGDMNASFIFYNECFRFCPTNLLVFPIATALDPEKIWNSIIENKINVIFGMPTFLTSLFSYFNQQKLSYLGVNKIYFLGEHMSPHHLNVIQENNPQIVSTSAGHTAVDVGLMGYATTGTSDGVHHSFDHSILEIIDLESGEPITEPNRLGSLICTNLVRRLMPLIRYPVGDICEWLEPEGSPNRKYKLHRRTPEAWSLASASYRFSDLEDILNPILARMEIVAFQIKLSNIDGRDKLELYVGSSELHEKGKRDHYSEEIKEKLIQGLPHLMRYTETSIIWPIEIHWIKPEHLATNERTAKLKRIIDAR